MTRSFSDVALAQRACRSFSPAPVAPEAVRRVLVAATHAPSAANSQPWRFVVVTDPHRREQIAGLGARAWAGGAQTWSKGSLEPRLFQEVAAGATGGLAGAPVLVVVAVDVSAAPPAALGASVWPAVQNLLLAAAEEGLGSVLTTLPAADPDALASLVALPDGVVPVAVVPLGHPAKPLGAPRRRPVDEVAFAEVYGQPLP